jgi:hypothetical protein
MWQSNFKNGGVGRFGLRVGVCCLALTLAPGSADGGQLALEESQDSSLVQRNETTLQLHSQSSPGMMTRFIYSINAHLSSIGRLWRRLVKPSPDYGGMKSKI